MPPLPPSPTVRKGPPCSPGDGSAVPPTGVAEQRGPPEAEKTSAMVTGRGGERRGEERKEKGREGKGEKKRKEKGRGKGKGKGKGKEKKKKTIPKSMAVCVWACEFLRSPAQGRKPGLPCPPPGSAASQAGQAPGTLRTAVCCPEPGPRTRDPGGDPLPAQGGTRGRRVVSAMETMSICLLSSE